MADVPLRILMSVAGGNALSGQLAQLASSLGPGGIIAGALIGLGTVAVQSGAAFQNAMLQNEAHAGLAASQVQTVNQALLAMGPAVGQGPTQLAQALYPILSGFSGIQDQSAKTQVSLAELKLAAESVVGTTTSVTTVSNAATAAFNAYGMATNDAATNTSRMTSLFDIMNSTVSAGNMQWSSYAEVIGKLSVSSRAAGVSFVQANAALADLTNQGYSAQLASTYLGNTFTDLFLKTDNTAKAAAKLGLSFDEAKYKGLDLAGKIAYLNQVTGGNQSELLKLLNGNSVALKTFDALSNSIGVYKGNLDALNHSQGATQQAFDKASSGFSASMQKLGAAGQSLMISLGTLLLPVLTDLVTAITPVVTDIAGWVAANDQVTQSISGVNIGLEPRLRQLWDTLNQVNQTLNYDTVHAAQDVQGAFASVGNGFSSLGTNAHNAVTSVGNFFSGLGTNAHNAATSAINWLEGIPAWFESLPGRAAGYVNKLWTQTVSDFQQMWTQLSTNASNMMGGLGNDISGIFKGAINGLIGGINDFIEALDRININIPGIGHWSVNIPTIPYMASGGIITSPGLAVVGERGPELLSLPTGAGVAPLSGRAGGVGPTYIFYVSLSTMARSQSEVQNLVDLFEQEIARRVYRSTPGYAESGVF